MIIINVKIKLLIIFCDTIFFCKKLIIVNKINEKKIINVNGCKNELIIVNKLKSVKLNMLVFFIDLKKKIILIVDIKYIKL